MAQKITPPGPFGKSSGEQVYLVIDPIIVSTHDTCQVNYRADSRQQQAVCPSVPPRGGNTHIWRGHARPNGPVSTRAPGLVVT
jgi:hypothetical protein